MTKYRAVIFDLFGTLVDNPPYELYEDALWQVAAILSVPFADLRRLWDETTPDRRIGAIPTVQANLELICQKLGVKAGAADIDRAARVRNDMLAGSIVPRADAVSTLSQVRARGLKVAMVSNCTPETPTIWDGLPLKQFFDTAVFSCTAGVAKPDRRIYEMALAALKVRADDCLYVGDGESEELSGAAVVGMHPVMIRVAKEETDARHLAARQPWDGPTVSSLTEVLTLLR